ncbi:MAG: hypothetical protein IT365_11795 [Candidatus Hydrogenedentes bacterium]|nr:hypothetical protein [Candidatus Hydrogenedentota bacterium]
MNRLSEALKVDQGLIPMALNNTNTTGRYFKMKGFSRALWILNVAAMAATKTAQLQIMEATDEAGTGGQAITAAVATITANAAVKKATVALASVLNTQTLTITVRGVSYTFTAHTDTTTAANLEFSISGNDSADADELVSLINHATYGVPGVTASNNAGTITLTVDEEGDATLTISASAATFTIATVEALAYVEIENYTLSAGFSHVAAKVTTTANTVVSVALLREARELPVTQYVGASAAA